MGRFTPISWPILVAHTNALSFLYEHVIGALDSLKLLIIKKKTKIQTVQLRILASYEAKIAKKSQLVDILACNYIYGPFVKKLVFKILKDRILVEISNEMQKRGHF